MPFVCKTHYVLSAHISHAEIEREKSKLECQFLSMAATKEPCLEKNASFVTRDSTGGGKRFKI